MERKCRTCKWECDNTCRLAPPILVVANAGSSSDSEWRFPFVEDEDWCSKFIYYREED